MPSIELESLRPVQEPPPNRPDTSSHLSTSETVTASEPAQSRPQSQKQSKPDMDAAQQSSPANPQHLTGIPLALVIFGLLLSVFCLGLVRLNLTCTHHRNHAKLYIPLGPFHHCDCNPANHK